MATGQAFFAAREQAILNLWKRGTAITAPAGLFGALIGAAAWLPTHVYADGTFVVSTKAGNCRLFKSTSHSGTGTSGAADPFSATGTEADGSTVTDNAGANQIIWTEQTLVLESQADGAALLSELSGSSYARINIGLTNYPAATAAGGGVTASQTRNGTAISTAAASADWVPAVIYVEVDASANGVYQTWARFPSQVQVRNGQKFTLNINDNTWQVD